MAGRCDVVGLARTGVQDQRKFALALALLKRRHEGSTCFRGNNPDCSVPEEPCPPSRSLGPAPTGSKGQWGGAARAPLHAASVSLAHPTLVEILLNPAGAAGALLHASELPPGLRSIRSHRLYAQVREVNQGTTGLTGPRTQVACCVDGRILPRARKRRRHRQVTTATLSPVSPTLGSPYGLTCAFVYGTEDWSWAAQDHRLLRDSPVNRTGSG